MMYLNFRSRNYILHKTFRIESYVFTDFDIILSNKLVNAFGHRSVLCIFGYFVFLVDTLVLPEIFLYRLILFYTRFVRNRKGGK